MSRQPTFDFFRSPATQDVTWSKRERDQSLVQVEDHAAPDFLETALAAVYRLASRRSEFVVDEVWTELQGAATTHDNRAMGPVMMKAKALKWIAPTERFQSTAQVMRHAAPVRIWRSLL